MSDKMQDKTNKIIKISKNVSKQLQDLNLKKETRFTIRLSDEELKNLELLKKKFNIGSTGQLVRNMINVFYEAEFKKKA